MWRRAPWRVVLAVIFLILATTSPVFTQNQNPPPGRSASTTAVGTRRSRSTNGGGNPNPVHSASGGNHTGAIIGGTAGAAAAGIALFELLHHPHPQDSGKSVQRLKLTMHYPEDWQLNPRLSHSDDPISFNNFNSSYVKGGIIPRGGADIDIARLPRSNQPVSKIISDELSDADQKQFDEHEYRIDGQKGTRVFYTDTYAPNFVYKNVAVYVAAADGLYKFFLTYHEGDPHEKSFNQDFEHMLKSVHFQR